MGANDKKAARCRKKFLYYFPGGFRDKSYLEWERNYKWNAHLAFKYDFDKSSFDEIFANQNYRETANNILKIESKTNLLFSFEKMALRDAVKSEAGAKKFIESLYGFIYGSEQLQTRFENYARAFGNLPRKQTRVKTWPAVTVFGFLAVPRIHIFLKPRVTQVAAKNYGYHFKYESSVSWPVYADMLTFAHLIKKDLADLRPRDMIDIQSFIWVMGSDEYP